MEKHKTLIIGGSIAAVLLIVVIAIAAKPADDPYSLGVNGYNNYYPPGYVPQPGTSDKAALYTAGASVINKSLDTFFGSKNQS